MNPGSARSHEFWLLANLATFCRSSDLQHTRIRAIRVPATVRAARDVYVAIFFMACVLPVVEVVARELFMPALILYTR